MAKVIQIITFVTTLLTLLCTALYWYTSQGALLTLAIVFGTTAYHFIMRLAVGSVVNSIMHNKADLNARWFRVSVIEMKIYQKLKVHKWKNNMPTYDLSLFDRRIHTWEEIAGAMCQAEVVHEVIFVLSFLPILAAIPFGELVVFAVTSLLAALFDLLFVMMQRYNRTRIVKILDKRKINSHTE